MSKAGNGWWRLLAVGLVLAGASCSAGVEDQKQEDEAVNKGATQKKYLESYLAGAWYAKDAKALGRELQEYLAQAPEKPDTDVIALVQPHAGYQFSGPTAAYGAKLLQGRKISRVIVMGPSHRVHLPHAASVPGTETHYRSPLGEVPLDRDFIACLLQTDMFRDVPQSRPGENSVEMQLPILQAALGEFKLVPIVVGQLDLDSARRIGQVLRSMLDAGTVVVASSDFTHYGPNFGYVPFTEEVEANLKKLDMGAIECILARDAPGFMEYCRETGATICGHDPIAVLLAMLPEKAGSRLLHYDTSGHMTGDFGSSVSYASIAFTGSWDVPANPAPQPEKKEQAMLSAQEKKELLKLARESIAYFFKHQRKPRLQDLDVAVTPGMRQVMGVFVTLHEQGELRGCIGEIFPRRALHEAVLEQALNSAFHDTRFMPLRAEELPMVEIEISALTPPRPVDSYHDILLGKHGMVLSKRGRSAVFLPQVAPEQGWNLDQTLTHLSMKAGLPPDAWKQEASFTVFEAIVFNEKELK